MHVASDFPVPGGIPDSLTPNIQWNPEQQDNSRNTSHRTVGIQVTTLLNPRVGIEGQKETKSSCLKNQSQKYIVKLGEGGESHI
jgi:hypothetical protein